VLRIVAIAATKLRYAAEIKAAIKHGHGIDYWSSSPNRDGAAYENSRWNTKQEKFIMHSEQ